MKKIGIFAVETPYLFVLEDALEDDFDCTAVESDIKGLVPKLAETEDLDLGVVVISTAGQLEQLKDARLKIPLYGIVLLAPHEEGYAADRMGRRCPTSEAQALFEAGSSVEISQRLDLVPEEISRYFASKA